MKTITMSTEENEFVIQAAGNYLKAFKEVRPELIKDNFLSQFTKTGYFYDYDKNEWMGLSIHSFQEVMDWAAIYNANGIMPDSEAIITLLDVQEKTAVVKIEAEWAPGKWGGDYVLLCRQADKWRIASIFWQSVI